MSSRLTIDLDALEANYRVFERVGSIGAVVKADAYGLGVAPITRRLLQSGCANFFVAHAEEGLDVVQLIRNEGKSARVWVFEGCTPWNIDGFSTGALLPVLNSLEQVHRFAAVGGGPCAVHVDTGMQRLGVPIEQIDTLPLKNLDVLLLLTHFACADTPEHPLNAEQIQRFERARKRFQGVPVSIGGSAALLGPYARTLPAPHVSRPGIGLYGGNPLVVGENPVRTVAVVEAAVLQLREVGVGTSVGYGGSFVTQRTTRIATVGIGYADGMIRALSNRGSFAVQGVRVPILGRVSMDLVQVDVTDVDVSEGDWVEVMGHTVTLDDVARSASTVSYEILTGLGPRLKRIYRG